LTNNVTFIPGGWAAMNRGSLLPMALLIAALAWLAWLKRRPQNRSTT